MKLLFKVLMVMIIVGNPDPSNEIYISIEKDRYGADQILAINGHEHTNKRQASSTATSSSKKIRLSKELDLKEKDIIFYKDNSPLGLKLQKTPSFINSIELKLSEARKKDPDPKMDQDKLKASNFSAKLLRIGTWERLCRHEGDLIAKCYYAKKKIVWEILEGALKRKIEVQWSDIIGISAITGEHVPGILELELKHPPTYFLETNPQPRKHTLWQTASDFTGGQAPSYRRHFITFPPGILDKHYEKLLQCDERLFELDQKPFPTMPTPYFNSNLYGLSEQPCNLNRNNVSTEILPHHEMQQYHVQKFPTTSFGQLHHAQNMETTAHFRPCSFEDSTTPCVAPQLQYHNQNFDAPVGHPHLQNLRITLNPHPSNVDLPSLSDKTATNYVIDNQSTVFLSQGTNIIQGPSSMINISPQINSDFLNYQHLDEEEAAGMINPPTNSTSGISFAETADHQLDDTTLLTEQIVNHNTNNIFTNKLMSHEHQCYVTDNCVDSRHAVDQYCEANGLMLMPKPLNWLPPQEFNASTTTNVSLYPYHVFHESTQQDVDALSPTHVHHWG